MGGLDTKVMKGQVEKCVDIRERFDEAMEVAMALNEEEEQLGWMKTNFQDITTGGQNLAPIAKLWNLASEFMSNLAMWNGGPFQKLNYEHVSGEVDQTFRDMKTPQPEVRNIISGMLPSAFSTVEDLTVDDIMLKLYPPAEDEEPKAKVKVKKAPKKEEAKAKPEKAEPEPKPEPETETDDEDDLDFLDEA